MQTEAPAVTIVESSHHRPPAWVWFVVVGAVAVILGGALTISHLGQVEREEIPLTAEARTRANLGVAWAQFSDAKQSSICQAFDLFGPERAAEQMIDGTSLDLATATQWVRETSAESC